MNTFWLKAAGIAVVAVVAIFLIGSLTGGDKEPPKPPEQEKGFSDMVKRDREMLSSVPKPAEPVQPDPAQQQTPPNQTTPPPVVREATRSNRVAEPLPEFRELDMIDDVEAQRLMEWVITQRSMGRLPVMGYGDMVKKCRDIKRRWPGTKYAYQATKALADIPPRYHTRYKVKPEEMDIKNF